MTDSSYAAARGVTLPTILLDTFPLLSTIFGPYGLCSGSQAQLDQNSVVRAASRERYPLSDIPLNLCDSCVTPAAPL